MSSFIILTTTPGITPTTKAIYIIIDSVRTDGKILMDIVVTVDATDSNVDLENANALVKAEFEEEGF